METKTTTKERVEALLNSKHGLFQEDFAHAVMVFLDQAGADLKTQKEVEEILDREGLL